MSRTNGLCWNVYCYSSNTENFNMFNIFTHKSFSKDVDKIMALSWDSKRFFGEAIHKQLMYYFWRKCEYELILESCPLGQSEIKIDIYDQVMLNWNIFVDYLWGKMNEDCCDKG